MSHTALVWAPLPAGSDIVWPAYAAGGVPTGAPPGVVGGSVVRATVSGEPAASRASASTPGGLIASRAGDGVRGPVALVYESFATVMPAAASGVAAPSVTVAKTPEEQTPAVTVPLAQYLNESEVAVPDGT